MHECSASLRPTPPGFSRCGQEWVARWAGFYPEDVDLRAFRLQEFDGQRLSVRVAHAERQKLRGLAAALGASESEVVREALSVYISVMSEQSETDLPALQPVEGRS